MVVMPVVSDASALAYIGSVRWQFAKTMPDWPHEYTIKAWRPDLTDELERFCLLLENVGVVEPWPPPPAKPIYNNRYLVIGRHKYWAMVREETRTRPRTGPSSTAWSSRPRLSAGREQCQHGVLMTSAETILGLPLVRTRRTPGAGASKTLQYVQVRLSRSWYTGCSSESSTSPGSG
jgi:hypothetical protein